MDKTVEPLSRELDFITFLPKYRITYGSVNESPVVISRKMALMLKFKGSVTRIVTDINLSSGSETQIEVRGLWDSGAMTCCIKKSLSDSLNLAIVGKVKDTVMIGRPASDRDVVQLDVSVSDDIKFHELDAVVLDDAEMSTGFIIGMNLINKGVMIIDGRMEGWTLFEFNRF